MTTHKCACGWTVQLEDPKGQEKAFDHVFWNHPERIDAIVGRKPFTSEAGQVKP